MKKLGSILLLPTALPSSVPAFATHSAGIQGVYDEGKLHDLFIDPDNAVNLYEKVHSSSDASPHRWIAPWTSSHTASVPLPSGWMRQDPEKNAQGEGVIVWGNLLIRDAAAWDGSSNLQSSPRDMFRWTRRLPSQHLGPRQAETPTRRGKFSVSAGFVTRHTVQNSEDP